MLNQDYDFGIRIGGGAWAALAGEPFCFLIVAEKCVTQFSHFLVRQGRMTNSGLVPPLIP